MLTRVFYMTKSERSVSKQSQLQPHCHSKTRSPSNLVPRAISLAWLVTEQTIGTLSIDNEMDDDDLRNPRRIGLRVSFLLF